MIRKNPKIGFNLGSLKITGNVSKDKSEEHTNNPSNTTKKDDTNKTIGGFGSFGKIHNEVTSKSTEEGSKDDDFFVETNPDIARVMGFSGFGDGKKAKNFDMAQIMEEAKRKAQERNITKNWNFVRSAFIIF